MPDLSARGPYTAQAAWARQRAERTRLLAIQKYQREHRMGWGMSANGQSIIPVLIDITVPGALARSNALGVRQAAWEASLPRQGGGMFGGMFGGFFSGAANFVRTTVSHAANTVRVVARAPIGITRVALTGGSIKSAADQYITQPTGQGLKSPGVIQALNFIPVVGPYVSKAARLAMILAAMKHRRATERMNTIQEAQLNAQIAAIDAQIAAIKTKTKNAEIGRQSAQNPVASKTAKPASLGKFLIGAAIVAKVASLTL